MLFEILSKVFNGFGYTQQQFFNKGYGCLLFFFNVLPDVKKTGWKHRKERSF